LTIVPGIGNGILATLLSRPHQTLIAGVRDPNAPVSQKLSSLPTGEGSKLHIVKLDSSVSADAATAVQTLKEQGITSVDTIIANAATGTHASSIADTPLEEIEKHMNINLIGVLALYQAFLPLLKAGTNPKLIVLSSNLASMTLAPYVPGPWFCYGVTKASLNYFVRRAALEEDWLTVVALQPGWVKTDMGNFAAKCLAMEEAPTTIEDSVKGCVEQIDAAAKEKSGEWVDFEGKTVPW
jgi:norsolorinic acid ketoreductase